MPLSVEMFPIKTISSEVKVCETLVKIQISKGSDYTLIMISQNSKLGNFSWSDPFTSLMGDPQKSLTSQIYSAQLAQTLSCPFLLCLSLDAEYYVNDDQDVTKQGILLNEITSQVSKLLYDL